MTNFLKVSATMISAQCLFRQHPAVFPLARATVYDIQRSPLHLGLQRKPFS